MLLCLADDLTGALEVGALLAAAGHSAVVRTAAESSKQQSADVLVFDTETRHLSGPAAAARIAEFVTHIRRTHPELPGDGLIYKKTDSTLRGNIGAEMAALQSLYPGRSIRYVPAYPAFGRTVVAGCLIVDGVPIDQTEFGRDALNPVTTCRLQDVLSPATGQVVDGQSDQDVRAAAEQICASPGCYLVAGPAAIATHLAHLLPATKVPPSLPDIANARILVVNGSRHPVSLRQMNYARSQGCFSSGRWHEFAYAGAESDLARATATGAQLASELRKGSFDGILVFGGDTAFGIYAALGEAFLEPIGELHPGVPVSRSASGLLWITKAGGFGPDDLIVRLMRP